MLLAKWIESVWKKRQILDGYLVTARFEKGIYGFHRAFRYFFTEGPKLIESWEAFILVERLGNVRGQFLGNRVREQLRRAISGGLLDETGAESVLNFYSGMVGHHFTLAPGQPTPEEVLHAIRKA